MVYVLFLFNICIEYPVIRKFGTYSFKSCKGSLSPTYLEPTKNCRVVTGTWNKLSYFKNEWFHVCCPPGFARRWLSRRKVCFIRLTWTHAILRFCHSDVTMKPSDTTLADAVRVLITLPEEDNDIGVLLYDENFLVHNLLEASCNASQV